MGDRSLSKLEILLKKLGYSRKWLNYGFLDLDRLEEQGLQLASGEDPNPEHYRFRTFRSILSSRSRLSDEDVDHYIELASEDPDQTMGLSALKELAEWRNLEESGYQKLSTHRDSQTAPMRGALLLGRAMRDAHASRFTPESCTTYIEAGHSEVQRLLLDFAELSRDQLERLREIGQTRAVRNMAAAKLRMRRWRLR